MTSGSCEYWGDGQDMSKIIQCNSERWTVKTFLGDSQCQSNDLMAVWSMKWNECVGENGLFYKSTTTQFNATDTYYVAEDPQPDIDDSDSSVCDFD